MGFLGPFACASFVSAQCGTSRLSTIPHPNNESTHVETAMYQVCRAVESYGMLSRQTSWAAGCTAVWVYQQ